MDNEISKIDTELKSKGYKKYDQLHKESDYQYWKTLSGYQVGVLIYDFRQYDKKESIKILYECKLLNEDRVDLTMSKNINIDEFEEISEQFYNFMNDYEWKVLENSNLDKKLEKW